VQFFTAFCLPPTLFSVLPLSCPLSIFVQFSLPSACPLLIFAQF
jgi:hypothetical protein